MKNKKCKENLKKTSANFKELLNIFHLHPILSIFVAIIFSILSIVSISIHFFEAFPDVIHYAIYVCAVIFLTLATRAIIVILKHRSLKQLFMQTVEKSALSSRIVGDFSYRTMVITSCSLFFNIVMTAFKIVAGWYYTSIWLIVLSGYYIILIISKFIFIGYGRRKNKLTEKKEILINEWKAYQICGAMLLVLTVFLQVIVILIVRNGQGFYYNEMIVIAMAAYDFYCLGNAIFYMIAKRKKHSPIINSIKSISLASSLVAILSLQTAMFSSFGEQSEILLSQIMNIATGTTVCIFLIVLGVTMLVKANKELKSLSLKEKIS